MTALDTAVVTAFFIYSFLVLLQARALIQSGTLGSLSMVEISLRQTSAYLVLRKILAMGATQSVSSLLYGQLAFTTSTVLLGLAALYFALRDKVPARAWKSNPWRIIVISLAIAMLLILPLNLTVVGIFIVQAYGFRRQAQFVIERGNIQTIMVSEVVVRTIGCAIITTKVAFTGDKPYLYGQLVFAAGLAYYLFYLFRTGLRSGEIKRRWKNYTA